MRRIRKIRSDPKERLMFNPLMFVIFCSDLTMSFVDETMKNPSRDLGKSIFNEINSEYDKKKYNDQSKTLFNIIILTRIAIFDKDRLHYNWLSINYIIDIIIGLVTI